ncbi:MAG: quinate 5-dehydrogenase [Armatimonadetes bacterium]|nr:quinate 5-dehydrogenase [Armatimonadota bacterium]
MKRVVSVSLGSSKRDKTSRVEILGQEFEISRVGTDGDMRRFAEMVGELDGKVDAIGLGGIDRYLWTDKRRYTIRDADRLARIAKTSPVVDGSGIKNTLERKTIEYLQSNGLVDFASSKVLVVCAVDRFGMAQTIARLAKNVVYGDLMFSLQVPIAMRSYSTVRAIASLLLPVICRLPFQWLYPTGEKQDKVEPKHQKYYDWANVIAGDFLIIKRTMPTVESGLLKGKVIVTNTVTEDDVAMLRERGVRLLVTSSPAYDGRYYATNVFEGVMIALMGKRPEDVTVGDYEEVLGKMNWKPTITELGNEECRMKNAE